MSNNDLEALDSSQAAPRVASWALRPLIRVGRRLSNRRGFVGILGTAILTNARFALGAFETIIAVCLSVGMTPVFWHFLSTEHEFYLKLLGAASYAGSIAWTWKVSVASRDREALLQIMLSFGRLLKGDGIDKQAAIYQYLVERYKWCDCTGAFNPIETIKVTSENCKKQDTLEVEKYYGNHGKTAADWLCVIFSDRNTAFFDPERFGTWLCYFHGFNRRKQPTDRITRIFSTPVKFRNGHPAWDDDSVAPLSHEDRFALLAYLFINRSVGVDTKLHCFDPTEAGNSDFFHCGDYVLVYDPAAPDHRRGETLFVAIPGNETECLRLEGRTVWTETFRFEFYNRLTEGHGPRKQDRIVDAATDQAVPLAALLGQLDVNSRWGTIEEAIREFPDEFSGEEIGRLRNRWSEWFPAT